ncbi:MAG TPA: alternative ribosome rescue aminoacyl-tRNA hydrolase ArfB [Gemmatimonadaceae bacterium]|nr:alternative ribosome rescue aminoacyl-tRNA hydrolase ArfB [Gemmatimonadaceae bacterium]
MSDDALQVDDRVAIPRGELVARATRSGGPGGQHVNTSSTRIELLWNVITTRALDEVQRQRVLAALSSRIDGEGTLRIVASASRSQLRNREDAERRLAALVARALVVPRTRKKTRPTRAAKAARLEAKKRQSRKKADRRKRSGDE